MAQDIGKADGVLICDGSGFPKKGEHSVGVQRQYCGALGKIANCQQGVFVAYASSDGYTFVDRRLYLPEVWFSDEYAEKPITVRELGGSVDEQCRPDSDESVACARELRAYRQPIDDGADQPAERLPRGCGDPGRLAQVPGEAPDDAPEQAPSVQREAG